jgi:DNA mismatch endonuclease (patch repair protein)
MADIFSKAKRSEIMSKISGKETKPEIIVRKHLFSHGFRYRKNEKKLPGKPDIVLPKYKTVIFVHGCFWHGHQNCKKSALPQTNHEFWENKIQKNIERDKSKQKELKKLGWKIITVWQCQIKSRELFEKTMKRTVAKIQQQKL